jgi:hypothetical protein
MFIERTAAPKIIAQVIQQQISSATYANATALKTIIVA